MLQSILLAIVFMVSAFSCDSPIVKTILLLLALVVLTGGIMTDDR